MNSEWWNTPVTFHEFEELCNIGNKSLLWPGDCISHASVKTLTQKGFVCRMDGYVALTKCGAKLLKQIKSALKEA